MLGIRFRLYFLIDNNYLPSTNINNSYFYRFMNEAPLNNYYLSLHEPDKSSVLAIRDIILKQDKSITNELKYGMPFFCYKGKMFCYIWIHKKNKMPYIGFVEGKHFDEPYLIQESRSRMKIFLIDPNKNLPVKTIAQLIYKAINLYINETIKFKNK